MKLKKSLSTLASIFFLSAFVTSTPVWATKQEISPLKPTRSQAITSIMVVKRLEQLHYNKMNLDDNVASMVFDRFIEDLDGNKSYFLASDIKEFEAYRFELDDALESGNLAPAFYIFNRYQERLVERLEFTLGLLDKGLKKLDFDKEEYYKLDRSTASWPKDKEAMDDLWRRRIKNIVLNSKLGGKSLEKIEENLVKRFKNNLNRTLQANNEDAFQIYINALTQTYDPHTQYFSPRVSENFNINMSLQLQGIGAVLQSEDEYTKVVRLVRGGPADKGNQLQPADKIIGVGQAKEDIVDVVGWRLDEVVDRIRGEKGTTVKLEVIPAHAKTDAETKVISIVRDTVKLEDRAAQSETFELEENGEKHKYGIISIPAFYADFKGMQNGDPNYRSTTRDVAKLIEKLKKKNIDGLVIDLRNNGGGSLQEANSLVGLFIETGPTVQVRASNGKVNLYGDSDPRVIYDGPIAVVVNRLSASASEIFAGAIQDYQRGIVIGERTFGKGTVQSLQPLDQGQLKITLAKFYRISGESNQHKGIIPDIKLPSIIDFNEIGESSLENALPSDHIQPANYSKDGDVSSRINFLRASHKKRTQKHPDFVFLNDQIETLNETRDKNRVSLKEEARIAEKKALEQRRLAIENKKRKAKDLPLFESIEELKEDKGDDAKEVASNLTENEIDIDFVLTEVTHILNDYIAVSDEKSQAHIAVH